MQAAVCVSIRLCRVNSFRLVYLVYIGDGSSDSSPERHQSLGSKAMVNGQPAAARELMKRSKKLRYLERGRGVGKEKKKDYLYWLLP